ncbi:MAG TPA: PD-(D/E)XK nuclease family protein, partial [Aggregatilineaceae bacterium]|nr:PD-(D/E)XK nuclease family protein [Aggregatilineaceae bacterium]
SRLLKLEAFKEPEEGPDIMQIGTINHEILEKTYTRIADEDLIITADNLSQAQAILHDVAGAVFAQAPRKHGFRPTPLWDQECAAMLRRLDWLIRLDFEDFNPLKLPAGSERRPFWQEVEFGRHGQPFLVIDGEAGPVLVRGVIDRVDRAGDQIIIMDYKTGARPHPTDDMIAGRDVQMMIYLLAAQELLARHNLPYELAGGLFWHIRSRTTSGDIHANDPAIETARQVLHHNILRARQGDFAVHPTNGQCAAYCEFGPLCRVSRAYHRKP